MSKSTPARRGHKHKLTGLLSDSLTAGDVLFVNASSELELLPVGSNGQFLSLVGGLPAWATAAAGVTQLSDLSDVNTSTPTNRNVLVADGVDWESRALVEADISDLGSYAAASHTHTESDITDLGSYLSNVVEDTTPQLGGDLDLNSSKITDTHHGATTVSIETITTGNWAKPQGYSRMVSTASTGEPSGAAHGYYFITARRDTGGGYGALYQEYNNGRLWSGYNTTGGDPTWVQLCNTELNHTINGTWTFAATPSINVGANSPSILTLGETSTARGDSQDAQLRMYGEHTGTIYGGQIAVISANMQFTGIGGNPVTTCQYALDQQMLTGHWTQWHGPASGTLRMTHDNTNFNITGTTSRIDIEDTIDLDIHGGVLRIRSGLEAGSYRTDSHDATDFNSVFTGTTDWNISGITAIQAGAVDADFDAITATSYGGITEANLLDKSAAETISGAWSWSNDINMQDNLIDRAELGDLCYQNDNQGAVSDANVTLTYTDGPSFQVDLENWSANRTITISGGPPTGTLGVITVYVTQDGTAARTVTWAGGTFMWRGGIEKEVNTTLNGVTVFTFETWDGGTTWLAGGADYS